MPVFNGEQYIEQAIESILSQTLDRFVLIISDNASTDRTEEICRAAAQRDARIRYVRNEQNIGAAANYNNVFRLSSTEYFKWAAHDDMLETTFLERCVSALRQHQCAALAYPKTIDIDEYGNRLGEWADPFDISSRFAWRRIHKYSCRLQVACNPVFGVIRASHMRDSVLIGNFASSDVVFLFQMALRGCWIKCVDTVFYRRVHPEMSRKKVHSPEQIAQWYGADTPHIISDRFRHLFNREMAVIRDGQMTTGRRLFATLALRMAWIRWRVGKRWRRYRTQWTAR